MFRRNHFDALIIVATNDIERTIIAPVVHYNKFKVVECLSQRTLNSFSNISLCIVGTKKYTNFFHFFSFASKWYVKPRRM